MKTKNLVIIFILFLLITLASASAVFLTEDKSDPAANEQVNVVEKQAKPASAEMVAAATSTKEKIVQPEKIAELKKTEAPINDNNQAEEKIKAAMIISGVKYETAVKPGSSVYDLMNLLKAENKINFSGKDYASLGFFVEEINGLKNNPAGKNWLYYVNGRPAPVGVSYYLIKANDIIEWKYENKSF